MTAAPSSARAEILRAIPLESGWEMASTSETAAPEALGGLRFIPARAPCTVASVLREQGLWRMGQGVRFDSSEHWFRCRFEAEPAAAGEELILELGGIATLAEVWLNGHPILKSNSMFAAHNIDVTPLVQGSNELLIVCRPLERALRERRRSQPAARWRTRVIAEQQLRWFRTTLLGRAPGFAPEPDPVGPWRPVRLLRRRLVAVESWTRRLQLDRSDGIVETHLHLRPVEAGVRPVAGHLLVGDAVSQFEWSESAGLWHGRATARLPNVTPWWPHTHGTPALYPVRAEIHFENGLAALLEDAPAGFRTVEQALWPATGAPSRPRPRGGEPPLQAEAFAPQHGFALSINGEPVFCRGVVWTPIDIASLAAPEPAVRQRLTLLRDAGFNMVRLAGTMVYEDETFHRICDELGLLVWQDMMFANMDYPYGDSEFRDAVQTEAKTELTRLARHPSTAVICGNSEIEQQATMLGLEPSIARGPWFGEDLPGIAAQCCPGVPYVPSAPSGGDLPFRTRSGVANYFGVGAYLRPFDDVRRADVRFASECLAFANVPEPEMVERMAAATPGGASPIHPAWKRGVPRDAGVGWDFEDVRDHYLKLLYSLDPAALRYADQGRYLELSRMVSGEVMAEVFGEWRRAASPCGGGIVLWCADLEPGAGWGILDANGRPKAAYWFLKRALAPRTVWMTDEGLNGIDVHVANDAPDQLSALLRVAIYRRGEQPVAHAERRITLPAHTTLTLGVEQILGRFVDAAYAFRFGPPGHDLVVASLHADPGEPPFAQSFRFPTGRSADRAPIAELGLSGRLEPLANGAFAVTVESRRFAWGVRIEAPGFLPDDAYFEIEPGGCRRLMLVEQALRPAMGAPSRPRSSGSTERIWLTAVNAEGRLPLTIERPQ